MTTQVDKVPEVYKYEDSDREEGQDPIEDEITTQNFVTNSTAVVETVYKEEEMEPEVYRIYTIQKRQK